MEKEKKSQSDQSASKWRFHRPENPVYHKKLKCTLKAVDTIGNYSK